MQLQKQSKFKHKQNSKTNRSHISTALCWNPMCHVVVVRDLTNQLESFGLEHGGPPIHSSASRSLTSLTVNSFLTVDSLFLGTNTVKQSNTKFITEKNSVMTVQTWNPLLGCPRKIQARLVLVSGIPGWVMAWLSALWGTRGAPWGTQPSHCLVSPLFFVGRTVTGRHLCWDPPPCRTNCEHRNRAFGVRQASPGCTQHPLWL